VVGAQQWAEIGRMVLVQGRSQREVAAHISDLMPTARDRPVDLVALEAVHDCTVGPFSSGEVQASSSGAARGSWLWDQGSVGGHLRVLVEFDSRLAFNAELAPKGLPTRGYRRRGHRGSGLFAGILWGLRFAIETSKSPVRG
jgi:hypothetical protein